MQLDWFGESQPRSVSFDDIYYAKENGLEEARYLFIQGNRLLERWRPKTSFVVGELGFGTGLNFLAIWEAFCTIPEDQRPRLHFVSCEKFPLTKEQMRIAHQRWPELRKLSEEFLKIYDIPPLGFHRMIFEKGKLTLSLLIGDARECLLDWQGRADAWCLDGFAPKKNPEMWSEELFRVVGQRSNAGATFATYTSAGFVKRNLIAAGFETKKIKGFGPKWESLTGTLNGDSILYSSIQPSVPRVAIVGAGIAGLSVAHALFQRGIEFDVFETQPHMASQASSHTSAIFHPLISAIPTAMSQTSWASLLYLRSFLRSWIPKNVYNESGILILEKTTKHFDSWTRGIASHEIHADLARYVNQNEAKEIARVEVPSGGIFIPRGGFLNLKRLTQELASPFSDRIQFDTESSLIDRLPDAYTHVVFANAHCLSRELPGLRKVRGQLLYIRQPSMTPLQVVLCGDGFITPASGEEKTHCIGATYDRDSNCLEPTVADTQTLLRKLSQFSFQGDLSNVEIVAPWVQLRASRAGQEIVAGQRNELPGNIFMLSSLGSRGSLFAPLAGDAIASLIDCREPHPFSFSVSQRFSPQRLVLG